VRSRGGSLVYEINLSFGSKSELSLLLSRILEESIFLLFVCDGVEVPGLVPSTGDQGEATSENYWWVRIWHADVVLAKRGGTCGHHNKNVV
jgi:hypothetical protein